MYEPIKINNLHVKLLVSIYFSSLSRVRARRSASGVPAGSRVPGRDGSGFGETLDLYVHARVDSDTEKHPMADPVGEMEASILGIGTFGAVISRVLGELNTGVADLKSSNTKAEDEITDLKNAVKKNKSALERLAADVKNGQASSGGGGGGGGVGSSSSFGAQSDSAGIVDFEPEEGSVATEEEGGDEPSPSASMEEGEEGEDNATGKSLWSKKGVKGKIGKLGQAKPMAMGWATLTRDLVKLRSISKDQLNKSVAEVGRNLRDAVFEASEDSEGTNLDKKFAALKSLCETLATNMNSSLSHVQLVNETTLHQIGALEKYLNQQKTNLQTLSDSVAVVEEKQEKQGDMLSLINAKLDYLFFGAINGEDTRENLVGYLKGAGIDDKMDFNDELKSNITSGGMIGRVNALERKTDKTMAKRLDVAVEKMREMGLQQGDLREHMSHLEVGLKGTITDKLTEFEKKLTQNSPFFTLFDGIKSKWLAMLTDMEYAMAYSARILGQRGVHLDLDLEQVDEFEGIEAVPLDEMTQIYPQHEQIWAFLVDMVALRDAIREYLQCMVAKDTEAETIRFVHSDLDRLTRACDIFLVRRETAVDDGAVYVQDAKVGGDDDSYMLDFAHVQADDRSFTMGEKLRQVCNFSAKLLDMGVPTMKLQKRIESLELHERLLASESKLKSELLAVSDKLNGKVEDDVIYADLNQKAAHTDLLELRDALFKQIEQVRIATNVANDSASHAAAGKFIGNAGPTTSGASHAVVAEMQERFDLLYKHFEDMRGQTSAYIERTEVEEAMTSLVGEVKLLKANYVDRSTFTNQMDLKAEKVELSKLVDGLSLTVGELAEKSTEVGLFEASVSSQRSQQQLQQVASIERRNTSNNADATLPRHTELYRPNTAAIMAARCLVCDKLVDDSVRPLTQPSRRMLASKERATSPVPNLNFGNSSMGMSADSLSPNMSRNLREIMVMSNSMDLPPISDNSRAISIQSDQVSAASQKIVDKTSKRLRVGGGGGMSSRMKQNTR